MQIHPIGRPKKVRRFSTASQTIGTSVATSVLPGPSAPLECLVRGRLTGKSYTVPVEDNEMGKRFSIFVVCVLAFACSHATNPAAPSTTGSGVVGSSPVTTGAAISGTVVTTITSSAYRAETAAMTVTVSGTRISATIDGKGQFTLTGVPPGTVQLMFTGPGVNAALTINDVGEHDEIHITVRVNGNTAE